MTATGKEYAFIFSEIARLKGQISLDLPIIFAVTSEKFLGMKPAQIKAELREKDRTLKKSVKFPDQSAFYFSGEPVRSFPFPQLAFSSYIEGPASCN